MLIRHEPNLIARPRHPNHYIGLPSWPVVAHLKHTLLGLVAMLHKHGDWKWNYDTCVISLRSPKPKSLTLAAKSKLHTSQPSLSRQLRDLEEEIGAQLMTRTARGVELTPAGQAFLDHARSSIAG